MAIFFSVRAIASFVRGSEAICEMRTNAKCFRMASEKRDSITWSWNYQLKMIWKKAENSSVKAKEPQLYR